MVFFVILVITSTSFSTYFYVIFSILFCFFCTNLFIFLVIFFPFFRMARFTNTPKRSFFFVFKMVFDNSLFLSTTSTSFFYHAGSPCFCPAVFLSRTARVDNSDTIDFLVLCSSARFNLVTLWLLCPVSKIYILWFPLKSAAIASSYLNTSVFRFWNSSSS